MNLNITLPDDLYQRVEEEATQRGASIEALMQEALEEYLEDGTAGLPPERAKLLASLEAARAEYAASGQPWLDWEGIEREVVERRGGVQWGDE
jgi:predicted transcriptional regulator